MSPNPISLTILPAPKNLEKDVECFRLFEYAGRDSLAIKIAPIAVPGIVFQHKHGQSAIKRIAIPAETTTLIPTAFIYGPGIKPSIMEYEPGPWRTVQVILRPHALKTLLGLDAPTLADNLVELNEVAGEDLNGHLMNAASEKKRVDILTNFLIVQSKLGRTRDTLIEESLDLIQANISSITKTELLKHCHISERQFEKRFRHIVGVSPLAYIRVTRFNEAIRLMKTGEFERLTDVAHALNFYDQSHFIRDLKEFSGITPTSIFQKVENFQEQGGFSYV